MKFLALLFLVGFASASVYDDALDEAADELIRDFMVGLEKAPSLKDALGLDEKHAADEGEDETEVGKKLRESLNRVLEKIKDAVDHGRAVKEDLLVKLKELKQKMKDAKVDFGSKAKELLEKIRDHAKEFLKNLWEKLGLDKDKVERSLREHEMEVALRSLNIREMFQKLKKLILSKLDKEALKQKVEELFGKGSELADQLLNILKEKGDKAKQKLLDLVDRVLGEHEDREERSISETFDKIRDFFKKIHIEIKEKFANFGEWIKEAAKDRVSAAKSEIENLKEMAKKVAESGKDMSKDVAAEALEFLRPYKEKLGKDWDNVKETVKDVLKRKD